MSRASWGWMPGLEKEIGREAGEWKQEINQLFFFWLEFCVELMFGKDIPSGFT